MKLRSMFSPIATVLLGLGAYPMSYGNAPVEVPTEPAAPAGWRCLRAPEVVRMRPTQQAPGSRATMTLTQPPAPFGIAVDTDGHQTYDVRVVIDQLRRREGSHYVVWAATPELDQSVRIGLLGPDNHVTGRVAWNKFLVFVSEESASDIESWAGPILLTGLSPSGRMHTMAGHGPFEDVSCSDIGP